MRSMRRVSSSVFFLGICAATLVVAAPGVEGAAAQESTVQVSSSQTWTDTGLDLVTGDAVEISAAGSSGCDPKGAAVEAAQALALPLPAAPRGALIARLHAQGAAPMLVGAGTQLKMEEPSHLYLGMNFASGQAACEGNISAKISRKSGILAATQNNTTASGASEGQKSRGDQLRSQLSTAAQVFMSGQFGTGKSDSGASSGTNEANSFAGGDSGTSGTTASAPALNISSDPLDPELRKSIDGLPRRVNDQLQNQGDMVNFVIVGSQKDIQAVLDAANWHVADTDNKRAVLNALMETYEQKDYLAMPMSTLYLFGRKQDFGYEMAEPIAMVASRHHFRIWKAPFAHNGREVWVGAGTHDIGFAKDKRNNGVTHKIDPAVDGERDNIAGSLQRTNKTKTVSYYLPPNPVQDARNATGDGYHSDGRLVVIILP